MGTHAILSPSSAARWMACPASVSRTKGLVDKGSKYADEGTAAHFLAAHCLASNAAPSTFHGNRICLWRNDDASGEDFEANLDHSDVDVTASFGVDSEMVTEVTKYVDYVQALAAQGMDLYVEQRLPLLPITGEKDAGGTSDAVLIDLKNEELIIVDLKYGQGESVGVFDNPQLVIYALAAMEKFQYLCDFKRVRAVIHQPRKDYVGEHTYTLAEMQEWREKVSTAALATNDKNAPAVAGKKQCRWCKASGNCKEQDDWVKNQIGMEFEDLTKDRVIEIKEVVDIETLDVKMNAIDMIEDWCKAVRARVEALLLQGVDIPSFKLVKGRMGSRKWVDENDVQSIMKSMRLKVEEMYDMKLISPTTAEKLLKDQPKRWARLQDQITQAEGGLSVAAKSDKRPAVQVEPAAFDDVTHEHLI